MTNIVYIDGKNLSTQNVFDISHKNQKATFSSDTKLGISQGRDILEKKVNDGGAIYGVNTGFGEMVYHLISRTRETELQENLIRSHAAGVGPLFSKEESKAILLARLNALSRGYSGIRQVILDRLLWFLNQNIIPAIPEQGSLGASGDLNPLSHIAVTLIGEGYMYKADGAIVSADIIYKEEKLEPLKLKFKEGLALINGTSAMTGLASLLIERSKQQLMATERVAALSCEVLEASLGAFQPIGHEVGRPHAGQIYCAKKLREYLAGSKLVSSHDDLLYQLNLHKATEQEDTKTTDVFLQKAYTLRCIPQIHGAIYETVWHASNVVVTELNSSNDNPLFFTDEDVFHGGNFHGQPIAFVMDFLGYNLV